MLSAIKATVVTNIAAFDGKRISENVAGSDEYVII